jgi:hypothetical protein
LLKVAEYAAIAKAYDKAILLFDQSMHANHNDQWWSTNKQATFVTDGCGCGCGCGAVADVSLQNSLLRYSVKDYFLSAILCRLCIPVCCCAAKVIPRSLLLLTRLYWRHTGCHCCKGSARIVPSQRTHIWLNS